MTAWARMRLNENVPCITCPVTDPDECADCERCPSCGEEIEAQVRAALAHNLIERCVACGYLADTEERMI
jgi:hypothetical protein